MKKYETSKQPNRLNLNILLEDNVVTDLGMKFESEPEHPSMQEEETGSLGFCAVEPYIIFSLIVRILKLNISIAKQNN